MPQWKHQCVFFLTFYSQTIHSLVFRAAEQLSMFWKRWQVQGASGDILPLQDPPKLCLYVLPSATAALLQPPWSHLLPSYTFQPPPPRTLLTIPKHGLSVVHSLNLNYGPTAPLPLWAPVIFLAEGAFSVRGPQPAGEACGSARGRQYQRKSWTRAAGECTGSAGFGTQGPSQRGDI